MGSMEKWTVLAGGLNALGRRRAVFSVDAFYNIKYVLSSRLGREGTIVEWCTCMNNEAYLFMTW